MIPTVDYFEPTGDLFVDLAVKLNLLTQEGEIEWVVHEEDPRSPEDPHVEPGSAAVPAWFTYTPKDVEWTFLLYGSKPVRPTEAVQNLTERIREPHLQLLDSENRVSVDIPYRDVTHDLYETVLHASDLDARPREVDSGGSAFLYQFASA